MITVEFVGGPLCGTLAELHSAIDRLHIYDPVKEPVYNDKEPPATYKPSFYHCYRLRNVSDLGWSGKGLWRPIRYDYQGKIS